MEHHKWDGYERRQTPRNDDHYYEPEILIEKPKSPFNWAIIIPIIFTVLSTISGFLFGLYNRTTALENKQNIFQEKIDERKKEIQEMKEQLKKIDDKIDSVDLSIMEMYRSIKTK